MNENHYNIFELETGFLFDKQNTSAEIDSIFQKCLGISDFDGLKETSSNLDDYSATLFSADNRLKLEITVRDIVLTITNNDLTKGAEDAFFKLAPKIMKEVHKLVIDKEIIGIKFVQTSYTFHPESVDSVKRSLISPKVFNEVSEYDVDFDTTPNLESDLTLFLSFNITTSHTAAIHEAFKSKKLEAKLDNTIIIRSNLASVIMNGRTEIDLFFKVLNKNLPLQLAIKKINSDGEEE